MTVQLKPAVGDRAVALTCPFRQVIARAEGNHGQCFGKDVEQSGTSPTNRAERGGSLEQP